MYESIKVLFYRHPTKNLLIIRVNSYNNYNSTFVFLRTYTTPTNKRITVQLLLFHLFNCSFIYRTFNCMYVDLFVRVIVNFISLFLFFRICFRYI